MEKVRSSEDRSKSASWRRGLRKNVSRNGGETIKKINKWVRGILIWFILLWNGQKHDFILFLKLLGSFNTMQKISVDCWEGLFGKINHIEKTRVLQRLEEEEDGRVG
jgi:hypothetical protein